MTNTKNSFKLPEKDKKLLKKIDELKTKKPKLVHKLELLREDLKNNITAEKIIEKRLSKSEDIAKVLENNADDVDKLEKDLVTVKQKQEDLKKQIEKVKTDLNKINKEIPPLQEKAEITYFVELQQLLWNLHQDTIINGTDHSDLLDEIKDIRHSSPNIRYVKLMQTKLGFDGFIKKVKNIKEVSG